MYQAAMTGVIPACVICEPEVKKMIKCVKQNIKQLDSKIIEDLDKAIELLSTRKIGALITIERRRSLDEFVETGTKLDANVSADLLVNIFATNTPLNEGSVIIRNDKIVAANVCLPLTQNTGIPKELEKKHQAAVGVSEVTDAVTIVVSEKTGHISIVINEELKLHLTKEEYIKILREELVCGNTISDIQIS